MARVIGLMSGTSLDGVDAAWLETDGRSVQAFGPSLTLPYDAGLRRDLRDILDRAATLSAADGQLASVTDRLTEYHAQAVEAIGWSSDLIGFHGQTILHQPHLRRTWQIGDAAMLSRRTGLPVAFDFRSADVAAGGQGAPLAPVYHLALAQDLAKPLVVLNIGGVANVTWIGCDGSFVAFDTGPGNALLDDWTLRHTGRAYDRNGALAQSGCADIAVLDRLLSHPYFQRPAPKSLDRLDFVDALLKSGIEALSPADGAATLVAFTVASIAGAPLPEQPIHWLVCGGGRHNPAVMDGLRARLRVPVDPVEIAGWNGDALEAQCFGFLAVRVQRALPVSFPQTTGVGTPMTGGRIISCTTKVSIGEDAN